LSIVALRGPLPPGAIFVQSWADRVGRAATLEALNALMAQWHQAVMAGGGLRNSVGFDSNMEAGDWEAALGSITRTYGRSSRDHEGSIATLRAAIFSRSLLQARD
jgi:hypothetical protein